MEWVVGNEVENKKKKNTKNKAFYIFYIRVFPFFFLFTLYFFISSPPFPPASKLGGW
jgi:hypothetical protein